MSERKTMQDAYGLAMHISDKGIAVALRYNYHIAEWTAYAAWGDRRDITRHGDTAQEAIDALCAELEREATKCPTT